MKKNMQHLEELVKKFRSNNYTDDELLELFEATNSGEFEDAVKNTLPQNFENVIIEKVSHKEIKQDYSDLCEKIGLQDKKKKTYQLIRYIKYAAMFLLPLSIGILTALLISNYNSSNPKPLSFAVERGNKGYVLLGDGSKIWLNSNSKLLYTDPNSREVTLEGEAYFEVAHHDKDQFRVKTDQFDIVVYGTSFNVSAYKNDKTIKVALVEGSIAINKDNNELFKVTPGQLLQYNRYDENFKIADKDLTNVSIWKNRELIIRDLDDTQLYAKLEAWYGVDIKVTNKEKQKRLYNLVITHETLEDMLSLIGRLSPMECKIEGKEVTISYK